jgi:hypothetical protein
MIPTLTPIFARHDLKKDIAARIRKNYKIKDILSLTNYRSIE